GDMPGGTWLDGRRQAAQRTVAVPKSLLVDRRMCPPRPAGFGSLGDDLVVDIGDVADHGDLQATELQPPAQDVEVQPGTQVADVRGALHRRTAQVDRGPASLQRDEVPVRAGCGVVELERHPAILRAARTTYRTITRLGDSRTTTRIWSVPSSPV